MNEPTVNETTIESSIETPDKQPATPVRPALRLRIYPDEALFAKCQHVNDFIGMPTLTQNMLQTMEFFKGIGLAAPQVGISKRIFVVAKEYAKDNHCVFINPTILSSEGSIKRSEGCLSLPGVYEDIDRPATVKISASDENGDIFELEADGMLARIILHENDHLDGYNMLGYLSNLKKDIITRKMKKLHRKLGF